MTNRIATRIPTGIPGLDEILHGGFVSGRTYLVTGAPGTGKTIFGLHFLAAAEKGARPLFVSFTQTEHHLRMDAESVNIPKESISFLDLTPEARVFSEEQSYDIFSPVEVERDPIARAMRSRIEELNPPRVFIDGFSELRMVSSDLFHFVRMAQSFFRFVTDRGATVVVSSTEGLTDVDVALQAITDGVIRFVGRPPLRSVEVIKMRGGDFRAGLHPLRITGTGLEILRDSA